jgi:hypothetical protein
VKSTTEKQQLTDLNYLNLLESHRCTNADCIARINSLFFSDERSSGDAPLVITRSKFQQIRMIQVMEVAATRT